MPRTTVTNAQVLQAIDALSRQVQSRDEPLEARLDEVAVAMMDFGRRMDRLEGAWTKEARRDACPFRDDIVSGANNKRRLENLEGFRQIVTDKLHSIELQVVKYGLISGGTISAVVALADKLLDAWRASGGA
jgi:hypothetical protein